MARFGEWIEIKTRPLTEEEKKEYEDECEWYEFIYDCELPDHGQEVLISTRYGVAITTFYTDMGCYFENYEDEDDVVAWMPLPYKYAKESKSGLPTIKEIKEKAYREGYEFGYDKGYSDGFGMAK